MLQKKMSNSISGIRNWQNTEKQNKFCYKHIWLVQPHEHGIWKMLWGQLFVNYLESQLSHGLCSIMVALFYMQFKNYGETFDFAHPDFKRSRFN